jgi:asparagine synthase (glutamine-hydrolysing)
MCGICGIAFLGIEGGVDAGHLTAMRDTLVHRGPDGAGLWISADGRVGLGHRRLAIIDLSPASAQPMANEDGMVQVVFNGEIYNHAELRSELLAAGHRFATDHSDTEVLVHGYEEWGMHQLLQRLKGMFAIALWDANKGQLYLVRDRLGIKPLYWTHSRGVLLFASEIKGLLAYPGVERAIQPQAMYHYLTGMATPAPLTMFKGIYKLPAAHALVIEADGSARAWPYWDPLPAPAAQAADGKAHADAVVELRERLERSVREHLVSDVPVGVFLSGGVDSSSILASMTAAGQHSINSFSVGFKDWQHLNELDQARQVAKHFGARHHEVMIDEADMRATLDRIVWSQDEPLADWVCVPLYHVAGLAAKEVKVAMVGEGADEPFAGYDGYQDFLRVHQRYWTPFRRLPQPVQNLAAGLARGVAGMRWDWAVAADFATRAARDQEVFWGGATTLWETQKHLLLDMKALPPAEAEHLPAGLLAPASGYDSFHVIKDQKAHLERHGAEDDVLGRMIYYELKYRLPELLLMRVDKMTMAHSLEARVPFLDHELIELALRMPSEWKVRGGVGKAILKDAVRGLIPDSVIDRPKMGFGAPMAEWLRGNFGHEVEHAVLASELFKTGWFRTDVVRKLFQRHRSGARNHATYLWVLYNLTAWHERWIAGPARS